jgi:hypothetical protein
MVANPFLETETVCLHFNHDVRQCIAQTRLSASEMDEDGGELALVLVCTHCRQAERLKVAG